jgi:branched-subunit amino acid ABC-type transport system permease component
MLLLQVLLNSTVIGVETLLIGAGLYLIYNVAGMYAVHLGAAMMASAYTYYAVVILAGGAPFLGWLAAILLTMILMLLSYYLLRPTIRTGERSLSLLISIALLTGFDSVLGLLFGSGPKFLYPDVLPVYEFAGLQINITGIAIIGIGIFATLVAAFFLHATPLGRKLRAVKQHRQSGEALGLNVSSIQAHTFMIAGALVAVMGILATMNDVAIPAGATPHVLTALIAFFVGGVHSFKGLVICTFGLILSVEVITSMTIFGANIASTWTAAIMFGIALLVLLIKPEGVFTLNKRLS